MHTLKAVTHGKVEYSVRVNMIFAAVERTSDVLCGGDDAFGILPLRCVAVARKFYKYMHIGTLLWFDQRTQTIAPIEIESEMDKERG